MDLSSAVYQISKAKVRHTCGFACAKPHPIRGRLFLGLVSISEVELQTELDFPGSSSTKDPAKGGCRQK